MINPAEKLLLELEEDKKNLKIDTLLTALTLVGLLGGIIATVFELSIFYKVFFYAMAFLCGGIPIGKDAIIHLFQKKLDIDLLMVLAALAAALVGDPRDGAILLFLFSLSKTLEKYAMGTTKRAVASLMKLRPEVASLRLLDGTIKQVAVADLKINQEVVIKPGDKMPVDGVIISGNSSIDQSSVTGESVPVDKHPGDLVFAGTVNSNGALIVRVTKLASHSTIAQMITLVTEAQAKRSPSEQFGDWFGARYTVLVLVGSTVSLLVFLFLGFEYKEAFYKAATLLVVASPCAIVISVPAAILSALSASARKGMLFKGGDTLETFGKVDIVAFDKTGTLTEGKMKVVDVEILHMEKNAFLTMAATLESQSEHPLAKSILEYTGNLGITPEHVTGTTAIPGEGIKATFSGRTYWSGNRRMLKRMGVELSAEVDTILNDWEKSGKTAVIFGQVEIMGMFAIADTVRDSAKLTIASLRKAGIKRLVMLTGDNQLVANNIGATLGILPEDIYGDLLPIDKVDLVTKFRQEGIVAFVGDGVNDAAALATSNVGVAMGSAGSDVALEAADVALLTNDMMILVKAHAISKKTLSIIKQNLIFAIGILSLMVFITVFFYLPLPLGVVGHEGGTLLVILNGLRLMWLFR